MKLLDRFLSMLTKLVKSKDTHYTPSLSTNHPLYKARIATIQSMNQNTSLIRKNKEKIYSKLFYSISLTSAVLIAVFGKYLNWAWILFFIDLILFLLVYNAIKFYKERVILAENKKKIIEGLNKLGINILY